MRCELIVSSPFSFTCDAMPKDAENQLEAALGAISALKKPYGTSFVVRPFPYVMTSQILIHLLQAGSLCSMFYQAHGNIVDWMYKRAGIKYSYAAHLRDTGTVSSYYKLIVNCVLMGVNSMASHCLRT